MLTDIDSHSTVMVVRENMVGFKVQKQLLWHRLFQANMVKNSGLAAVSMDISMPRLRDCAGNVTELNSLSFGFILEDYNYKEQQH